MCMVWFLFSTVFVLCRKALCSSLRLVPEWKQLFMCAAKIASRKCNVNTLPRQQYAKDFLPEGLPYSAIFWRGWKLVWRAYNYRGFERERVFAEDKENLLGRKNSYLRKQWNVDNRKLVHQTVLCNVYYYSSLAPVWMSSKCFFFTLRFLWPKKLSRRNSAAPSFGGLANHILSQSQIQNVLPSTEGWYI